MRMHIRVGLIALVAVVPSHAVAQDDHPLVSRYEGSTIASTKADESAEHRLVTGHGVGLLAPVASSAEPAARAKNRRVELVAR